MTQAVIVDAVRSPMGKGPRVAQHRGSDPQLGRDRHGWSATALQQSDGLSFELGCEFSPCLRHQTPSRSRRSVSEVSIKAREDHASPPQYKGRSGCVREWA